MKALKIGGVIAGTVATALVAPQLVYGVLFSASWLVGYNYGLLLSLFGV